MFKCLVISLISLDHQEEYETGRIQVESSPHLFGPIAIVDLASQVIRLTIPSQPLLVRQDFRAQHQIYNFKRYKSDLIKATSIQILLKETNFVTWDAFQIYESID